MSGRLFFILLFLIPISFCPLYIQTQLKAGTSELCALFSCKQEPAYPFKKTDLPGTAVDIACFFLLFFVMIGILHWNIICTILLHGGFYHTLSAQVGS